jgi:hypothetical protein
MSFWLKPVRNAWDESDILGRYNSASRRITIMKEYKRQSRGQKRSRSAFQPVPDDIGDSDRNQDAKEAFLSENKTITDIICVSGHSGVIDTGRDDEPRIPKIKAKCTTIFFSRFGQCSFTSREKITQDGFRDLEKWLKSNYYSDGLADDDDDDESLGHKSFVNSIVNGRTKEYFGMELPLTINLKDTNVHNLNVFCQGILHGRQPIGTKDPIIASSFMHINTADIRKRDPDTPLEDLIDKYFMRNTNLGFVVDHNNVLRATTGGPTHFTRDEGNPVTLDDIYTTISKIPGINLDTTVLLFFGCRGVKSHPGRVESSSENSSDDEMDGGKRKTKSNKKSVRRKGKNGSRRKGRSRRKWRHTMRRMRRGAGVRK